jgi:hypothetical protein
MYRPIFLLLLIFLLTFASTLHTRIIHVPGDSTTIQGGINGAVDGDTVMVVNGTYTGDGNRDIDFTGKAIVLMSENGPEVTIIDCEGDSLNPHRGFYFHSGEDLCSIVQGFTITKGWAETGGGMYNDNSSPTVIHCAFIGNRANFIGGGVFNSHSKQMITNCTISENASYLDGGGMFNSYSNPLVTNCMINGNVAYLDGGGMFNSSSEPMVTNCMISGNVAYDHGGGMFNAESSPIVTNCTFSENSARFGGGGMYNLVSNPTVTNCILWDNGSQGFFNSYGSNPTVTYSNVQGGYTGEGNISADPLFVTFHGFDYLLDVGSPCIDMGDPSIEDGISDWHPRWPDWYPNGPRSDMGAYGGPGNKGWLQ